MSFYKTELSKKTYEMLHRIFPKGLYSQQQEYNRPLYFGKEEGSRIWDADGNMYLDLHEKYGAVLLGHQPPRVLKRFNESVTKLVSMNTMLGCQLGEKLKNLIPCCERIQLGLSGSEMVNHAIRLARAYSGRQTILRFEGNYHGTADGMYDKSNTTANRNGVHILPWNDERILLDYIDCHPNEVAGIITEPISVNGGGIMPHKNYLSQLRQICNQYNIVLIFDEVITGLRLSPGGAQTYFDVKPDICLYGKCLTNGLVPLTIMAGKEKIMELYEQNRMMYAGTYNGYAIGILIALLVLEEYNDEYTHAHPAMCKRIITIHDLFKQACHSIGIPIIIQGPPSCASFHITDKHIDSYKDIKPQVIRNNSIMRECMKRYGILTAPLSRIYPNFSLNDADVEFFAERIQPAVREAYTLMFKR